MREEEFLFFTVTEDTEIILDLLENYNSSLSRTILLKEKIKSLNDYQFFDLIGYIIRNKEIIITDALVKLLISKKIKRSNSDVHKKELTDDWELNYTRAINTLNVFEDRQYWNLSLDAKKSIFDVAQKTFGIIQLRILRDKYFDIIMDYSHINDSNSKVSENVKNILSKLLTNYDDLVIDLIQKNIDQISNFWKGLDLTIDLNSIQIFDNFILAAHLIDFKIWKTKVEQTLMRSDSEDEFYKLKNKFLRYIRLYNRNLQINYFFNIKHVKEYNYPIACSTVENWLENLYYTNFQANSIKKKSNCQKLILSKDFSQNVLLNILVKYFQTSGIQYNKNVIHSTIYHYTTIENSQNNSNLNSKLLDKINYQKIKFIPKESSVDIIRIFLKLLKKGIIKNGYNETFAIVSAMFQNTGSSGFSSYTIKYYWQKYKDINIPRVGNDQFWYYYLDCLARPK